MEMASSEVHCVSALNSPEKQLLHHSSVDFPLIVLHVRFVANLRDTEQRPLNFFHSKVWRNVLGVHLQSELNSDHARCGYVADGHRSVHCTMIPLRDPSPIKFCLSRTQFLPAAKPTGLVEAGCLSSSSHKVQKKVHNRPKLSKQIW